MNIGRKIYFEKATGNVILDTGERSGDVVETTQDQDFQFYAALQGRVPDTVGVISLQYGQDRENFNKYPYHIDITKNPIDETATVWDTANPLGASLAEAQSAKLVQINDLYNQKLAEGFASSASGTACNYGYAQSDRDKFVQLALKVLLKGSAAFPVTVHPKDGSSVSLDQAQYTQLINDIDAFAEPLDAKQHDFITQVNSCSTIDQVNTIGVNF